MARRPALTTSMSGRRNNTICFGRSRDPAPGRHQAARRRLLAGAVALAICGRAGGSTPHAPYPLRPLRMVLPSTSGGTSDLLGRIVATHLADALGEPVVIDLRPGAAGRIGADAVATAAPDGYTLLMANNGTNAIVPGGRGTAPRDLARTLAPVMMLARLPIAIAVAPSLGMHTLQELVARARRDPKSLAYASGGAGSTSHLAAALLFRRAGVEVVHVPYPGTSAAVKDVLSGDVPVLFTHLGTIAGLLADGQLRALAVTGSRRMRGFPGIPTVAEGGYPGFDVTTWHGIMVPAATPTGIVARLEAALAHMAADSDFQRQVIALGMEPASDGPERFAIELDADVRRWADLVRRQGIATE